MQTRVVGNAMHHPLMRDREEASQQMQTIVDRKAAIAGAQREPRVGVVLAAGDLLQLVVKGGDQCEVHLNVWELVKQPRHVQVVLRGMQSDPGQDDLARLGMPVVRLVHVPDDGDRQLSVHARTASSSRRRTNSRSCDARSRPACGPCGLPMKARYTAANASADSIPSSARSS